MLCWTVHLKGGLERLFHAALAVGHKVYSFGGCGNVNKRDQIDVHIFNTVSLRWMKLPPVRSERGALFPLEIPYNRKGHSAVLIEDIIYIWGGIVSIEIEELCNVLYAFDVDTHRWYRPKISGTVPEARYNHSACDLGKVMYIFGGVNLLTRYTNDIYKLDTTTMVWSLINSRGIPAPVSLGHSATIIGTKMFVFGGKGYRGHHNIMRVFDTETNCWMSTPSAPRLPKGRRYHSALAYKGELYIFGGDNLRLDRTFNDLWKFNPQTFSWRKVDPKGNGPYWMHRMGICFVGDRIILFGGYWTLNDLYILDLSPSLKTLCKMAVIQHGLEQSGLPHDIRWELAAMTNRQQQKENSPLKRKKEKNDDNSREQVPVSGAEERDEETRRTPPLKRLPLFR